jgi:Raf kinase inhibitor-like YbhB/YbcL family protein
MPGFRLAAFVLMSPACVAAAAAGFTVTSASYVEGSTIPTRYGADVCGGGGISPQVTWSGAPSGTKSMVVLLIDAEGAGGLTVPHWLVYNLPPSRQELKEGEAQGPTRDFTLGKNVSGDMAYRGMCPPVGDTAHHYYISVIATDLVPGRLAAGLSEQELMMALKGHALVAQSYFGRYRR